MQEGLQIRVLGVIVFLLLISRASWPAGPADNGFHVKVPEGLYLYRALGPMDDSIWFSPIMLVEKGKLVDPYKMARTRKGRDRIGKFLRGKTFNAFVGSDLVGQQEEADWGTGTPETTGGKKLFAPGIGMREEFPGMSFKDIYAKTPMYVRTPYDINFCCPRPILAPLSFRPSRKIEFLPVAEEDKERAVEAVRSAFLSPGGLEEYERELEREKLPKCAGLKASGGTLHSLQAFDIDNNGKKDLLGIYTIYASGRERDEGQACRAQCQMLFVLMDTGRTDILASDTHRSPGNAVGAFMDIDADGIQELLVLKVVTATTPGKIEDEYEDGRQLSIFRYDGSGWKTIYRTVPVLGGIH